MIVNLNHTGFVVQNLDKAVAFYRDVIGLSLIRDVERKGSSISQILGYNDAHIKAAVMDLGNDCGLELIEYLSPIPGSRPSNERAVLGGSHIAFNVVDIVLLVNAVMDWTYNPLGDMNGDGVNNVVDVVLLVNLVLYVE